MLMNMSLGKDSRPMFNRNAVEIEEHVQSQVRFYFKYTWTPLILKGWFCAFVFIINVVFFWSSYKLRATRFNKISSFPDLLIFPGSMPICRSILTFITSVWKTLKYQIKHPQSECMLPFLNWFARKLTSCFSGTHPPTSCIYDKTSS